MTVQYPFPADLFNMVGRVTRAHGLKGEIKVAPFSGSTENFKRYSRVALVAADGRMTTLLDINQCRVQKKQVILKLDTIDTKSEADLTVSMGVLLSKEDRLEIENDPPGHRWLRFSVWTIDEKHIGSIEDIYHNGAQELMVIRSERDEELLVPLVEEMIVSVDDGSIIIDPPPGLLEINLGQNR